MTAPAPNERTKSAFRAEQTVVTCAIRLCDRVHREMSDTAGGTVDQDRLALFQFSVGHDRLQAVNPAIGTAAMTGKSTVSGMRAQNRCGYRDVFGKGASPSAIRRTHDRPL